MNATQALARIRKVLGKGAEIYDTRKASSPERREVQRTERKRLNESKRAAHEALAARRAEVLAADAEYQRLRTEYEAAEKACDSVSAVPSYRYSARTTTNSVGGLRFSHLKAEADNLAELVDKVERGES